MNALDRLVPTPRRLEIDYVDLAITPEAAWERVRHGELGASPLVRALFAMRAILSPPKKTDVAAHGFRLDNLVSTPSDPGFSILYEVPGREVAVGAIGRVWEADIPFVFVRDADAFLRFAQPGFAKVVWAIQVAPLGDAFSRVSIEVRVDTTDARSWESFERYFRLIGPGSHFIRRSLLSRLAREAGTPEARENERPLAGDELLEDALEQMTDAITIAARPADIFPWLVQMGAGRAGFYSIDVLDNHAERSALDLHPELLDVRVGDVLPATGESDDGFEVLRVERDHVLVLGGLFDPDLQAQLPFHAERPDRYWQVTWSFVLEPLDAHTTKLHVRARAAFSKSESIHALWIRPVHFLMQRAQLGNLARRIEGRVPRDDWHEVADGLAGVAIMAAAMLTPFRRKARSHWGIEESEASRVYLGDDIVPEPRLSWTHAVEVEVPAHAVWPWVAQLGADRGGFYSYQWLENLAGCDVKNAETIHPAWEHRVGDALVLHPQMPPLEVVAAIPGHSFVAHAAPPRGKAPEDPGWVEGSWLFAVEPLGASRCRVISRYRLACSDDLATRLQYGPALLEPIGFAMDRRMLLGIKERAERTFDAPPLRHVPPTHGPTHA